jgi:hypothetical protein
LWATAVFATSMTLAAESRGGELSGAASAGATSAAALRIDAPEEGDGELVERGLAAEEAREPEAPAFWRRPRVTVGADAGIGRYWNARPAKDWGFGMAWQLRAGVQWNSIVATEMRWFGMDNSRREFDVHTTGFSTDVRLSLPLPLRPFLAAGLGWYTSLLYDGGRLVVSPPIALQAPVGAGVEVPVWNGMSVQLEFTHRFLAEGGIVDLYPATMQLWSVTAGARAYF